MLTQWPFFNLLPPAVEDLICLHHIPVLTYHRLVLHFRYAFVVPMLL
jgi:hypothetical protein